MNRRRMSGDQKRGGPRSVALRMSDSVAFRVPAPPRAPSQAHCARLGTPSAEATPRAEKLRNIADKLGAVCALIDSEMRADPDLAPPPQPVYVPAAPVYAAPVCSSYWVPQQYRDGFWIQGHWEQVCR